jgi:hypothetical protein
MEVTKKSLEVREKNLSPSILYYLDPLRQDDPATFKSILDGTKIINPTESMMYGTAVHAYMLERHLVVNVNDVQYPAEALKEFIDSIVRYQCTGLLFDESRAESLADLEKLILEQISSKGIKYGNYKSETLTAFIIKTYDDYYKMQVKYWGQDVILVNTKEQSLVSDAAAWLESDSRFKKIFYGEQTWTEEYVKVEAGYMRPLTGVIDRAVYRPEEKTLYITDLKLSSLAPKDFLGGFAKDQKGVQFGFYTIPAFQKALLEKFNLPADTKVQHWIAYYSRTRHVGCVFHLTDSFLHEQRARAITLLNLANEHAAENYWAGPLWLRDFEGY